MCKHFEITEATMCRPKTGDINVFQTQFSSSQMLNRFLPNCVQFTYLKSKFALIDRCTCQSDSNVNIDSVIVERFNYLDYEITKQWYRIVEALGKWRTNRTCLVALDNEVIFLWIWL